MALIPHYTQVAGTPAVIGPGPGEFNCDCGNGPLISGYEPRNFLDIAVQCAGCSRVIATPGLDASAPPPPFLTLVERGTGSPPPTAGRETVLISREEMDRLTALYQPRSTDTDLHVISDELLDDVELQHRYWAGELLPERPGGFKDHALGWAVARFREQLRDPEWTSFSEDSDLVAATVIAAFRDLIASWSHHPLFRVMAETAAAQGGFSLHGTAMFGVAKALAYAGNRVAFQPGDGARPRITSFQLILGGQDQMQVTVKRFDQFEWPDGAEATAHSVRSGVTEAMASAQGSINRLRPGILVLSPGAVEGTLEQLFFDCIVAALGSHGKRHRGLAAVSVIFPKIRMTDKRREVRFGYSFYPIAN